MAKAKVHESGVYKGLVASGKYKGYSAEGAKEMKKVHANQRKHEKEKAESGKRKKYSEAYEKHMSKLGYKSK